MPVELFPENIKAHRVYSLCRGQVITRGMDGDIVDISIPAIDTTMRWLKIPEEERPTVGRKVMMLARHMIQAMREERERQRGGSNG